MSVCLHALSDLTGFHSRRGVLLGGLFYRCPETPSGRGAIERSGSLIAPDWWEGYPDGWGSVAYTLWPTSRTSLPRRSRVSVYTRTQGDEGYRPSFCNEGVNTAAQFPSIVSPFDLPPLLTNRYISL